MSFIAHTNGEPGVGKLTIGRLLAARLNARLLDNHTLINPAEALFERENPAYLALRNAVRELVLGHAAEVDPATPLVFTDALAVGSVAATRR